ncbi:MAG: hypothetical protein MUO89_00505 [Dehalococcoidia bacterium]|nr:hypothetical protein [Dehalococcoidia bacterium]
MNKIYYTDLLHGRVIIEDDFYLKVISKLGDDWQRLESICALGLIGKVFPSATHTKQIHHIGTYHLATQVEGLTIEDSRKLCLNCLIRGIGHLPYTYSTAQALLLACCLSADLKQSLTSKLQPVLELCKSRSNSCAKNCLEYIFTTHDYRKVHQWLTAYKIIEKGLGNEIGDVASFVNMLVCPDNRLYRIADILGMLDYVQRDMRYSGIGELKLPSESFVPKVIEQGEFAQHEEWVPEPEIRFAESVRDYLGEILYSDKRVVILDTLFKRQLTELLVRNEIQIDDLLHWSDRDLEAAIVRLSQENTCIKSLAQLRDIDWPLVIKTTVPTVTAWGETFGMPLDPIAVERKLIGKRIQALTQYPWQDHFVIVVDQRPAKQLSVSMYANRKEVDLIKFLRALHRLMQFIENMSDKGLEPEVQGLDFDFGTELFKFIIGCQDIRFDSKNVEIAINKWSERQSWKNIDKLIQRATTLGLPRDRRLMWMLRDLYRGKRAPKAFPESLCSRFIQDPYFVPVLRAIAYTMIEDYKRVENAAKILMITEDDWWEIAAYLKQVCESREIIRSWIRPLPRIKLKEGSDYFACDVIALYLRKNDVLLRVIECTKQKSTKKPFDDFLKLRSGLDGALHDMFKHQLKFEPLQYSNADMTQVFKPLSELSQVSS